MPQRPLELPHHHPADVGAQRIGIRREFEHAQDLKRPDSLGQMAFIWVHSRAFKERGPRPREHRSVMKAHRPGPPGRIEERIRKPHRLEVDKARHSLPIGENVDRGEISMRQNRPATVEELWDVPRTRATAAR